MPLQAITSSEPIPGYRIRERIGAGGYGEVWTADAPGGLIKAIKFVYGFLNEDRASRELKALNRIKMVRHPFLLSLERIEVVDGQLLIVTELAEASLKERFDECRESGLPGIPRDELIRYMRDTADVLDFMNEQHSLQHLDIKPENLLMLAGRVKVADFGLVKDIHDATASLMGGLTPLYAPPEVFDGRPSRRSDQYSLAIVYQEMLSGELPFPGTTAMQLARQHLHARPRVSSLPEYDQEIVLRALSKAPGDRFSNCRELIDALDHAAETAAARVAQREESNREPGVRSFVGDRCAERGPHTEVLGIDGSESRVFGGGSGVVPRVHTAPQVTTLPPIELDDTLTLMRPTVFLGVGRSAGRILLHLRRRFADRFGRLDDIPAFQMLMLDTDTKDLLALTQHRSGFKTHELVALPLRHAQDYRNESAKLLRWISRRWLYNIPKSLKTEGLRPLGRLAFVDHAQNITQRIRAAITAASAPEVVAQAHENTGLSFREKDVRVILVSSISGGTGSGMIMDLGYLVRHLLAELGFPDDQVLAVLTHSTGRTPREMELAAVNAYSTLCELNHCGRSGSYYPGERACGVPPREHDNAAFRDTYLVDLGQDLGEQQFDDAAEMVSNYLFLDTTTNAGDFFRVCRGVESRPLNESPVDLRLRTFGVHQFSCLKDDILAVAVEHLCHYVTDRWLLGTVVPVELPMFRRSTASVSRSTDRKRDVDYSHLAVSAERFVESIRLDVDSLIQEMLRHIEYDLGQPVQKFFREQIDQLSLPTLHGSPTAIATAVTQFIKDLDGMLGGRFVPANCALPELGSMEASMAPFRKKSLLKRTDAIREWLLDMVDDDTARIRGAQWLAQWLTALCKTIEDRVQHLHNNVAIELTEAERLLASPSTARIRGTDRSMADDLPALLELYCKHRVYERVVDNVSIIVRSTKGQVATVRDELVDLEREVRHLAERFDTLRTFDSLVGDDDEVGADQLLDSVGHMLADGVRELTERLDQRLATVVLKEAGGLRRLLLQGGDGRNKLPTVVRSMARTTVIGLMKTLDAADVMFANHRELADDSSTLAESLASARPPLLRCGGSKRLLVMLPSGSAHVRPLEILHDQMHEVPSVAQNNDGDFVLCYEVEQLSLTQVAVTLIDGRRDYAEFAARFHTRTDVDWSTLPDIV
ncbi:MAG: tubulin-like doman-containing protein [Pirellulaceae bacterium]